MTVGALAALLLGACSSSTTTTADSTTKAATSAAQSSASAVGSSAAGSGGSSPSVAQITGSGSGQVDQATYDAVIAGGATADDAIVQPNAWASKIKNAGVLKTGGTETGALFSLLNPETGKVEGFDAGLSQLLAR